ncbi:DUF309 domain-containing protein [Zhengella sp. ZM62]|uniref:DUF309 domain-containing protein n=1 Tax=Zhengella sedimenti TaxID=3390035 RepID=UPI0039754106
MTALEKALAEAEQAIGPDRIVRLDSFLASRLPEQPYRPGTTQRPESGAVFDISARAGDAVTAANWRESEAWAAGFVLLRRGFFWEAHEVWEPVWHALAPDSADRAFVQAAIQFANARLKAIMGRQKAARRIDAIATALFERAVARGFRPGG